MQDLARHPRLYLNETAWQRLREPPNPALPWLGAAQETFARNAAAAVAGEPLAFRRGGHNEHLVRARAMQTRVVDLLARWRQTDDERFRAAVMDCIREIAAWEYWSWITWRQDNSAPDAIYDLSYGENSATLAIAFDCLFPTLKKEELGLFLSIAEKWSLPSARKHLLATPAWWVGHAESNWNAVCAGGLGMLVLALAEAIPDAAELLAAVELSIAPFLETLDATDGGWPEGLGYWNYGMRYAFMYLRSHENATGRAHPLLALEGTRKTLAFPLDFAPHGHACSFGDVNKWSPLPFHYDAARRLGATAVLADLDAFPAHELTEQAWPNAAEWRLLHSNTPTSPAPQSSRRARLYNGVGWGLLADRWPQPRLYLALRGGTTEVPHSHLDLLSFHIVVDGEHLVVNPTPEAYLDTTFSSRRWDILELTAAAKNSILINGVGIPPGAGIASPTLTKTPGFAAIRLDATAAMGSSRDGPAASFCGRLFVLLGEDAILVLDRVELPHNGLIENRLHTYAEVEPTAVGAIFRGERAALRITRAATVPTLCRRAVMAPTWIADPPATVLRCATPNLGRGGTFATLITPGDGPAEVDLAENADSITVTVTAVNGTTRLQCSRDLEVRSPRG